jgi:hypothetical protein
MSGTTVPLADMRRRRYSITPLATGGTCIPRDIVEGFTSFLQADAYGRYTLESAIFLA